MYSKDDLRKLAGIKTLASPFGAVTESVKPVKKPAPVTERYETSASFDADMDKVFDHLLAAMKIYRSSDFHSHMKDTDANFDTDARAMSVKAESKLAEALSAAKALYSHMDKAA